MSFPLFVWKTLKNEVKWLFFEENFHKNMVDIIKSSIPAIAYSTWFETLKLKEIKEDKIIFTVPLEYSRDILISRYDDLIKKSIFEASESKINDYEIIAEEEKLPSFMDRFEYKEETTLNIKYRFENFIIGESNRFAHAASIAVSESPAQSYNPLLLYGGVGLGKTHLIHAIGNRVKERNPDMKVLYTTSETFTNEFIDSIKTGNINSFRDKFRNIDILMIDDVQFFGGKDRVQEEFFHTFNHLYNNSKQIILTSDRPPKDISTLEDRIRNRFEQGLLCDINAPDFETRVAILKKKREEENFEITDEILNFIASKIKSNVRELEGIITRLSAMTKLSNEIITQNLAEDVIKIIAGDTKKKKPQIETVIVETASYFNLDPKLLKSNSRKKDIALARQIAMFISRNVLEMSLPKIGEEFGGRDHTTVIHSIEKIEKEKQRDKYIENIIKEVTDIISN